MYEFMTENALGNEGVKALSQVLQNNSVLTELDLGCKVLWKTDELMKRVMKNELNGQITALK